MSFPVVTRAGAAGLPNTHQLAESRERVRQITRSGSGADHPLVERTAAGIFDPDRLAELAEGARVLVNGAVPASEHSAEDVPGMARSLLGTVERTRAVDGMLGNTSGLAA